MGAITINRQLEIVCDGASQSRSARPALCSLLHCSAPVFMFRLFAGFRWHQACRQADALRTRVSYTSHSWKWSCTHGIAFLSELRRLGVFFVLHVTAPLYKVVQTLYFFLWVGGGAGDGHATASTHPPACLCLLDRT